MDCKLCLCVVLCYAMNHHEPPLSTKFNPNQKPKIKPKSPSPKPDQKKNRIEHNRTTEK